MPAFRFFSLGSSFPFGAIAAAYFAIALAVNGESKDGLK
tara:strand:- start:571 stop:687 length:117 start_codon:yes stop_codon:yes gene_type:complete